MPRLRITPVEEEPFELDLEDELTIGRSTDCDLTLNDRFLSRQHARLTPEGSEWFIEDLDSRNGTFLNGSRLSERRKVLPGDTILLSSCTLTMIVDGVAETAAEEAGLPEGSIVRDAREVLSQSNSQPAMATLEELERYAARLRLVSSLHSALARPIDKDHLIELVLDSSFEHLNPEEAVIVLRRGDGKFAPVARRAAPGVDRQLMVSETLVREVAEKGHATLLTDFETDSRFAAAQSLMDAGVRGIVAAPLVDDEASFGMIALASRWAHRSFKEEDLELLVSLASIAALRLRNLLLGEDAAERRRLEKEVELARAIQIRLLPTSLPTVEGYELFGSAAPSRGVSGDIYQALTRKGGNEVVLMIADVSGKGIAASLLTASLEALAVAPIEADEAPAMACTEISRRLFTRTLPAKYATLFLATLDTATHRVTYCNAGHNPGLLLAAGGDCRELAGTGMPVGLLPDAAYTEEAFEMNPGDTLVLYTDGIPEAEDPSGDEFGQDRLLEVAARCRRLPLEELASTLEGELEQFVGDNPFGDDRTMLILRRSA